MYALANVFKCFLCISVLVLLSSDKDKGKPKAKFNINFVARCNAYIFFIKFYAYLRHAFVEDLKIFYEPDDFIKIFF